jgi:hypothetical protein
MKASKIIGMISLGVLALITLLWWVIGPHQPSDASLERRFNKERPELELLVTMMDKDWNMSRIASDFTWRQDNLAWPRPETEWGISKERWNDYKKLFIETRVSDGTLRREKSSDVLLVVWSWGIVPSGIGVSYLYCGPPRNGYAHTEPPCLENKDSGRAERSDGYIYRYKKIGKDWFIYEESE